MGGLSNLFTRNPRLTVLVVGLVLVAGLSAFRSLARQEDPTLTRRFGDVTTFFPGASAQRVETLVTEELEEKLLELSEVQELESLSRTGVSVIRIELADQYEEEDVDEIWSKVRDKIGDAALEFPSGVLPPEFEDRTSTAVTLLVGLVWDQDGPPQLDILTRLAEQLENQLRNVPHTRETRLYGEADEEIRVTVDRFALASVGLTAADVSSAIARADSKVPAGQLRHGESDLLIEVAGELTSLERIRRVPVRRRDDGRLLRVGDLARVEKAVRQPPESEALLDGRRGVAVSATMESDRRVDRWAGRARAVVEEFRRSAPRGVEVRTLFDQSRYTQERLGTLAQNLVLGAGIVIAVLFVMMGTRSAVIVGSALPLTVAMVLAELNLLGVPLHQTSVTGLIIALGLLIDNAIVVVDDYNDYLRAGLAPAEAVARTVRHLFVPLLASTLTTVLAFLPIVLMPGGAGEFVGPISIGVGLSVVSSFLLAMTVIPALAAFATGRRASREGGGFWRHGLRPGRLAPLYRRSLDLCIARPWVGVVASCVLPAAGFVASTTLVEQFFPPNDRNQFQIQLVLPSHASLAETGRHARRARRLVDGHDGVLESHWFVGTTTPRVFYNMFANERGVSSFAGAFVTTGSAATTERLMPALQRELIEAFPGARVIALPFEQGPPFEAPIEVRVVGPDLETLRALGEELRAVLARTRDVTFTTAKLRSGEPKLLLVPDEDEAGLAGLRLVDIAGQLDASLEGATGGSVIEATEEIPVRVRVGDGERDTLRGIGAGHLLPPERGTAPASARSLPGVPLAAVADVELVPELAGITRRNGERTNTVQAFLEPYSLIASSLADFQRRLEASSFRLPPGYRLELGGENEQRSDAMAKLMAFALPLFVLMAMTIVLSFDSFRMAGIIFTVALLSVGLALLGVWIFGYPMGFLAIVGTMGLVGLAINGGIVVLSALRASEAARRGRPEAIREVVTGATRHILSTTLTTIGGFIPLIVMGGRFWPPLATAIAGGVGGAAILSLYLVPSMFVWVTRSDRRRAERRPEAPRADGPATAHPAQQPSSG